MVKVKEMGLTWGRAERAVKNQSHWKQIVQTLCPTWDEKHYVFPLGEL